MQIFSREKRRALHHCHGDDMVRPDSRIWFPFASAISTGSTVACAYLFDYDPKSPWVAVFAGAIGAVFFWGFEFLTTELMNYQGFRRQFDTKREKFEGEWIDFYRDTEVDEASGIQTEVIRYAYFRIRFTGKSGEPYLIKGNSYDSYGHNYARWASKVIKFDGNKGIIDYFYFGFFFNKDYAVRGMANLSFDDCTSYVITPDKSSNDVIKERKSKFFRPHSVQFNSGTGYFIDSSAAGAIQRKFHFIRVTDEIVKKVMPDGKIHDLDAERRFVTEFHKKYGSDILKDDYLTFCKEERAGIALSA